MYSPPQSKWMVYQEKWNPIIGFGELKWSIWEKGSSSHFTGIFERYLEIPHLPFYVFNNFHVGRISHMRLCHSQLLQQTYYVGSSDLRFAFIYKWVGTLVLWPLVSIHRIHSYGQCGKSMERGIWHSCVLQQLYFYILTLL